MLLQAVAAIQPYYYYNIHTIIQWCPNLLPELVASGLRLHGSDIGTALRAGSKVALDTCIANGCHLDCDSGSSSYAFNMETLCTFASRSSPHDLHAFNTNMALECLILAGCDRRVGRGSTARTIIQHILRGWHGRFPRVKVLLNGEAIRHWRNKNEDGGV
jgi:hypothetical protein